jgi:hypothetical protein
MKSQAILPLTLENETFYRPRVELRERRGT